MIVYARKPKPRRMLVPKAAEPPTCGIIVTARKPSKIPRPAKPVEADPAADARVGEFFRRAIQPQPTSRHKRMQRPSFGDE